MGSKGAITMATTLMIAAFVTVLILCIIGPAYEKVKAGDTAGTEVDLLQTAEEAVEQAEEVIEDSAEIVEEVTDEFADWAGDVLPEGTQSDIRDVINPNWRNQTQ